MLCCGFVPYSARSSSPSGPSGSCATNDTLCADLAVEATLTPPESEARKADPWRNSFRSKDRHSSQNTADVSQSLLQRKHWLICNSSHLPGRIAQHRDTMGRAPPNITTRTALQTPRRSSHKLKLRLDEFFCTNRTLKDAPLSHQAGREARGTSSDAPCGCPVSSRPLDVGMSRRDGTPTRGVATTTPPR